MLTAGLPQIQNEVQLPVLEPPGSYVLLQACGLCHALQALLLPNSCAFVTLQQISSWDQHE